MIMKPAMTRRCVNALSIMVLLGGILALGPDKSPVNAFVPPPGLAAALLKALPTIGTVVGNLFNPKAKKSPAQDAAIKKMTQDSADGQKKLLEYAKRETIVWRIVSASGLATANVAAMRQITEFQTTLTKDQITDLNNRWPFVETGINAIVQSKPDVSVFDTNSLQVSAINRLLLNGVALDKSITSGLKYDPDKPNPRLLQNLQTNLKTLDDIFQTLNDSTGAEIEMIANELSAVATTPSSAADPSAGKAAGKKVAQSAFGNSEALDQPIQAMQTQLQTSLQSTITVQ